MQYVLPGGYCVVLYDTSVERKLRGTFAEIVRGHDVLLFASTCQPDVPATEVALLAWRLDFQATNFFASAENAGRIDVRDDRRARAVALRHCAASFRLLPGAAAADAAGSRAREIANAADEAAEHAARYAVPAQAVVPAATAQTWTRPAAFSAAANAPGTKEHPEGRDAMDIAVESAVPTPAEIRDVDAAACTAAADAPKAVSAGLLAQHSAAGAAPSDEYVVEAGGPDTDALDARVAAADNTYSTKPPGSSLLAP